MTRRRTRLPKDPSIPGSMQGRPSRQALLRLATLDKWSRRNLRDCRHQLANPLDHEDRTEWILGAMEAAKTFLGADRATWATRDASGVWRLLTDDFDAATRQGYDAGLKSVGAASRAIQRSVELKVATRTMMWADDYPGYLRSAYYNEYIRPSRAYDALSASLILGDEGSLSQLLFHHEQLRGPRFGRKGVARLHLLYGAFAAGAHISDAVFTERKRLGRVIDSLQVGMVIMARDGRIIHRNPTAGRALDDSGVGPELRSALLALRREMSDFGHCGTATFSTPGGPCRVSATPAPDALHPGALLVVIGAIPPNGAASRDRHLEFGLTPRQSDVADLLARRRTNREIAEALGISSHTARHHTERVLLKLGINRREQVGPKLEGEGS